MPILQKTLTIEWFESEKACNLPALRAYFTQHGFDAVEVTPDGIMRAHAAGILSSNWLARRILSGAEKEEYEKHQKAALDVFEKTMAPVLAEIVKKAAPPLP